MKKNKILIPLVLTLLLTACGGEDEDNEHNNVKKNNLSIIKLANKGDLKQLTANNGQNIIIDGNSTLNNPLIATGKNSTITNNGDLKQGNSNSNGDNGNSNGNSNSNGDNGNSNGNSNSNGDNGNSNGNSNSNGDNGNSNGNSNSNGDNGNSNGNSNSNGDNGNSNGNSNSNGDNGNSNSNSNNNGTNSIGISAENFGTGDNKGTMTDLTMTADKDSVVINDGTITLTKQGNPALLGYKIYNNGTVNLKAPYLVALQLLPSTDKNNSSYAENKGTINIYSHGDIGIELSKGKAINLGSINLNDKDSKGMLVTSFEGHLENGESGIININGSGNMGIEALGNEDNEGELNYENKGTININGSNNIGLNSNGSLTFGNNSGTINVNGSNNIGILASERGHYDSSVRGVGTNNNIINVNGNSSKGLKSNDGGEVINNKIINLIGNNDVGMLADGENSIARNHGIINLKGHNGIAMMASNKGEIINEEDGVIHLYGQKGFEYSQIQTGTNHENGYTDPAGYHHSPRTTPIYSYQVSSFEDIKDSNGNKAFKIETNGKLINKGTIIIESMNIHKLSDIKIQSNNPNEHHDTTVLTHKEEK